MASQARQGMLTTSQYARLLDAMMPMFVQGVAKLEGPERSRIYASIIAHHARNGRGIDAFSLANSLNMPKESARRLCQELRSDGFLVSHETPQRVEFRPSDQKRSELAGWIDACYFQIDAAVRQIEAELPETAVHAVAVSRVLAETTFRSTEAARMANAAISAAQPRRPEAPPVADISLTPYQRALFTEAVLAMAWDFKQISGAGERTLICGMVTAEWMVRNRGLDASTLSSAMYMARETIRRHGKELVRLGLLTMASEQKRVLFCPTDQLIEHGIWILNRMFFLLLRARRKATAPLAPAANAALIAARTLRSWR